jgi:outer membrane protein OmpA-like peptidoglycan-associated protein
MGTRRLALALLCASAGRASADGLDGERFVPAVGAQGGFVLEEPTVPFHLGWSLGLFGNFANDQVVVRDANGVLLARPLDTGATADLVGSLGLFGRLELGLHLPVHFIYEGDTVAVAGNTLAANAGIGDLRFVPKIAILRRGSLDQHVELGFALPMSFPTGNDDALRGAGGFTIEPELLFSTHLSKLGLGFDVGYRYRSQHPVGLPWGDEISLGPWVSFAITDRFRIRGELLAHKMVNADVTGADFPVEPIFGIDVAPSEHWDIYAGAGIGLTDGIGAPGFRLFTGVRYRHGAPEREGFRDGDADGILDKDDRCPEEPEDFDGYRDTDGCPEPDNDGDGIADGDDECPELSGDRAHQGCPAKTYVKIENGKVYIFGKVQFETGSARIQKGSDPLLDQIAEALDANPQIRTVRIEGHTDNVGDPKFNQRLSEERAQSVKAALERRKIDGDRLQTKGLGETRPVAPNTAPGGRQTNRRVEFIIVR